MNFPGEQETALRFAAYLEALASALGHADRAAPLKAYCTGLLLPGERKSIEPMAARLEPRRIRAAHQSLHHFVAKADWSDDAVLEIVRAQILPALERRGPIRAWIVGEAGFSKTGKHSVGVARQYCAGFGKRDNCQVAVHLSAATRRESLPLAYQLYLPENWASDLERREKAGVPEEVTFRTKPEIALGHIRVMLDAGVSPGIVQAPAGYGDDVTFRAGVTEMGLTYVVDVQSTIRLCSLTKKPRAHPPPRVGRQTERGPVSAKDLAHSLPEDSWKIVTWCEGSKASFISRFAAVRVCTACRDQCSCVNDIGEWFLVEWPQGDTEPARYWLSTLPETVKLDDLIGEAKVRRRIERDHRELKQDIGLGHYEGRGWRGFHHHATLAIAAYGFLVSERSLVPSAAARSPQRPKTPARPKNVDVAAVPLRPELLANNSATMVRE